MRTALCIVRSNRARSKADCACCIRITHRSLCRFMPRPRCSKSLSRNDWRRALPIIRRSLLPTTASCGFCPISSSSIIVNLPIVNGRISRGRSINAMCVTARRCMKRSTSRILTSSVIYPLHWILPTRSPLARGYLLVLSISLMTRNPLRSLKPGMKHILQHP